MDNTQQRAAGGANEAANGADTAIRLAIESNPAHSAQSILRPAGNAPWLPVPADGDPRPWPIYVLTPAQMAQFLANQPPSAAPRAKGQPAPTSQGGSPPANMQPRIAKAQGTGGQPIQQQGMAARPPAPTFQGAPGPTYGAARPQPFQAPPPGGMMYQAQPATRNMGQGLAITALVLGLLALVFTCGDFGWLPGVPGFIVGMVALNRYHPAYSAPNMKAIAGWGIALSILASVVSLVLFIASTQPR